MKKFIGIIVLTAALSLMGLNLMAQSKDYRSTGYHGNVMITDHLGVFVGAETSHGYMFDRHNYLGAGVGGFVFPNESHPTYMNAFIDYHHYLKDKPGTFVMGMKAGYSHAFNYEGNGGITFKNGVLVEPNVGWSWQLRSGKGLSLNLGASMIVPVGESRTNKKVILLPKLSFGFAF